MASSPTTSTSFLCPQAVSFLRHPPKPKPTPPPLRWNPLFLRNSYLTKSPCLPIQIHANFVKIWPHSSYMNAAEAEEENGEVKRNPIGVGSGGGGLFSWVLEAVVGPALAVALLGLFLTAASPCAALSAASSSFLCHPSFSSTCHSHFSPVRLGADWDDSLISLLMTMGSAGAVILLAGIFSDPVDEGNEPKLQVRLAHSLPRALDWICESTETCCLEGLSGVLTDYFTSQTYFRNQLVAPGVSHLRGRKLGFKWNNQICISRKLNFHEHYLDSKHRHLMKTVATSTPKCLAPNECDTKLLLGSELDAQVVQIQPSNDETPEIDGRERLRRMRISKANKGIVPWNKGRKHSPETIQRIREGTKLAMQNQKVKLKLATLGHAQSKETRMKISAAVREISRRRNEKLMVQKGCFFEWQNCIAESARKGCPGEDELQWDSYETLGEQLQQQWLESIEKEKKMRSLKGGRRAPKSPEHRRKISEAIAAKWADEDYRARTCSGMAKHYGTTIEAEGKRRKPSGETPVKDRNIKKIKTTKSSSISREERSIKKVIYKEKNSIPSCKDPMASVKFEAIKKIREQRAAREAKEVTERAKLLIAEAEKAAKALEMVALKSPLAQASLLETKRLLAEARWSIEKIETGTLTTQEFSDDKSLVSIGPLNDFHGSLAVPRVEKFDERLVNGFHLLPSSRTNHKDIDFDNLPLQTLVNGWEPCTATQITENFAEFSLPLHNNSVEKGSEKISNRTSQSVASGAVKCECNSEKEDVGTSEVKNSVPSRTFAVKRKKKWVHGRLIEVEEDDVSEEDKIQGNK